MSRRQTRQPSSWLAPHQTWPDGELSPDAPQYAQVTKEVSRRLRLALADRPLRSLATESGIGTGTISRVLAGQVVPDIATLASLEKALNARLWPGAGPYKKRPDNLPPPARRGRPVRTPDAQ